MLDDHRTKTLEKSIFFLKPGTKVLLQTGDSFRQVASYVGWIPDEVLILDFLLDSDSKIRQLREPPLIVRYMIDNMLYGFQARFAGNIVQPVPLIFLEDLTRIEALNVSKFERSGCLISAATCIDSQKYSGMVIDISYSGMKVILDTAPGNVEALEEDMPVDIYLDILGYNDPLKLKGIFRRLCFYGSNPVIGVKFLESQQKTLDVISDFIVKWIRYLM